jgi:hypothetical protein
MTESEWLACTDPEPMLEHLRGKASERKLRLFAVACCYEVWYLLRDKRSKKAATASERYADGLIVVPRMAVVREAARRAVAEWVSAEAVAVGRRFPEEVAHAVTLQDADQAAVQTADLAARVSEAEAREIGCEGRKQSQAMLLREIFGNPFRPVGVAPAWLMHAVVGMARTIYAERAFNRLPILSDALEEAGCTDAGVLDHLRSAGPHVRGCWALDLVLAKG